MIHLDVVYLSSTSASVSRIRLTWFGASMKPIRGCPVAYIPHTPAYTEKCKLCFLCGMFGARSSSGTYHNISRKECVTVVDAWGAGGARERCLGWWYRGMRRNTFSRTSRGIEAYWIIWISLEPRFRHTCDNAQEANSLLYRTGSNILSSPCPTFNPLTHTSTVQVSGRTPLEFGG